MLIFVSDIHLTDDLRRASIQTDALLSAVRSAMKRSVEKPTLILLGDIFELLRSDLWIQDDLRPWLTPDDRLIETTRRITARIIHANSEFFEGMRDLAQDGASLVYLPGNHDRLLAEDVGAKARALLRTELPLQGVGEALFQTPFPDAMHGVHAEHGHLFDEFNRQSKALGRFVPGDAVVVELIAALPVEAARALGSHSPYDEQYGERLAFLQEMDIIRPLTPEAIHTWLTAQVEALEPKHRIAVAPAIDRAMALCFRRFRQAMAAAKWGNAAVRWLALALESALWFRGFRAARALRYIPELRSEELDAIRQRFMTYRSMDIDLVVAGHTHAPACVPLMAPGAGAFTYLNTGTWCRVNAVLKDGKGKAMFRRLEEESMLCVYQREAPPDGQDRRYEFIRHVRGY